MEYITHNVEETIKIAKNYASTLKGGDVILLLGDMGAGKTAFTKGIAKGLGSVFKAGRGGNGGVDVAKIVDLGVIYSHLLQLFHQRRAKFHCSGVEGVLALSSSLLVGMVT